MMSFSRIRSVLFFFIFLLLIQIIFPFLFFQHFAFAQEIRNTGNDNDIGRKEIQSIIQSILVLRDPSTGISPSHFGHPGYEKLAFTYDKAVDALILKAAGHQSEAEEILDYFVGRLNIALDKVRLEADTNNVYGIIKLYNSRDRMKEPLKSFVNAVDITALKPQGRGRLEFWTTPGPISFMIFSLLGVNPQKYKDAALYLGEVLLTMQHNDGGIYDGDRASDKVHTEPHMDGYAAFLMLYEISRDGKWQKAADAAYRWFKDNVYHPEEGLIDQGVWSGKPNAIFAEDVYSWTMASAAGDKIPLQVLEKLTRNMLKKSLVRLSLILPDKRKINVVLSDFSDPEEEEVKKARGGFHPLGSVEWTGGAILALEKNAVRFYNAGDNNTAKFFKAIAEILFSESMKCFYCLSGLTSKMAFYATGQGVEIAPFGSISRESVSGWKTPYFYIKIPGEKVTIEGGSLIGAWPVLPYFGVNPFVLKDNYKEVYDLIPLGKEDLKKAREFIAKVTYKREFFEEVPKEIPDPALQIVEPELFNQRMWESFNRAYSAQVSGLETAKIHFKEAIYWANLVVKEEKWVELAKRDNLQKEREFGGIIFYPWGTIYPDNDDILHTFILRYPLLNEVGAAMWGLATANFELGDVNQAQYWINRIIEEVPLHQVAHVAAEASEKGEFLVDGYWNALVSWEDNPGGYQRDTKMKELYFEVVREKKLISAKPKTILITDRALKNLKFIVEDMAR